MVEVLFVLGFKNYDVNVTCMTHLGFVRSSICGSVVLEQSSVEKDKKRLSNRKLMESFR
jgi:hypothetical protein